MPTHCEGTPRYRSAATLPLSPCFGQRKKPMLVQTLLPESAVEASTIALSVGVSLGEKSSSTPSS